MSATFDRRFGLGGPCSARTMPAQPAQFSTYKSPALRSSSFPIIPQHSELEPDSSDSSDMRNLSFNGPYGMNISLSTAISGRFSITLQNRNNRASSEPAVAYNAHTSTTAPTPEFKTHSIAIPVDDYTIKESVPPRAPSLAPTEIEDPDPESILSQLESLNIKVRDFAYQPPYVTPPSSPSTSTHPARIPELFDQYKGIAEFEYRLAQSPRTVPIQGKTMRRLLDMEWVLYEEAEEKLHEMDWQALRVHDKKMKEGKAYPWRPCTWTEIPDAEGRKRCLEERGSWFVNYDKVRKTLDWIEEREEKERREVEIAKEAVRQWEMEERLRMLVDAPPPRKRALDPEDPDASDSTPDDPDAKRARLSQSQASSQSQSQSQSKSQSHPYPTPPPKQYPAPLSSYDPVLYPDAKSAIELSAQSQPRPVVPPRAATPPAEEPDEEEQRPGALVRRPKRLRRTLSRTQTFTQL